MEPLVYGDYPISMKKNAGARIPAFTKRESQQVKGSCDFIGLIFFTNINVTDKSDFLEREPRDFDLDVAAEIICMFFVCSKIDIESNIKLPIKCISLLKYNIYTLYPLIVQFDIMIFSNCANEPLC